MSEQMWVRSHVERLLQDEWSACQVVADDDGDYAFGWLTAACWVQVMSEEPYYVRVFAHAALDVTPSAKLLRELNDIQLRTLTATIAVRERIVFVAQTISPIGLTRPVLAQAMQAVGGVASDIGVLVAAMFGGCTPFDPEVSSAEEVA